MTSNNIEVLVQRLSSADTDLKLKVDAAVQLRDGLEHYITGPIYPAFLRKLMPIFINCLKGPPVFISTNLEQKLRCCVLEILHRLPTNPPESFEPYAVEVVDLLISLVRIDNEENATLCVKTIMDIMRSQTKVLQDKVQTFLGLIQDLFDQMDSVVRDQLDNVATGSNPSGVPSTPGSSQTFQNSPRPGSPVTTGDIGQDPQQQTRKLLKGMQSFKVLAECPIIVVSIFQVYRNSVPQNVKLFIPLIKSVLLLQAKPQEQAHIEAAKRGTIFTGVSPDIKNRAAFDQLLDERTLIGDGLTVYETMRPLAYSMLADLIHHVRDALEPGQIRKTVEVYTRNLQDSFPGTSFQTMSAKLLLNMAECIAKMPSKTDARHYLIMILNAIGDKFAAMNRQYTNAVKLSKHYSQHTIDAAPENYLADKDNPPDWDEIDIFSAMPIKISNPRDRGADPVADNKFLFKNLMNGLKNTFYQLKACNGGSPIELANAPPHWAEVSPRKPATESQYSSPVEFMANHYMVSSSKEEKDLLETFATVFHCIDPATFHEVFHEEIPKLYEMIFEHTALLHVPQFFLASEATSPSFAGMLLRFLMDRIDQVGTADNEQVLLPHVVNIVTKSIELSTTAEEPLNYFLLLRSLFRSIGGGKFEHLYKQILPLLEMLLEVLNNLLMAARKPADRDLYVELCLTVPARLSNLLPHLSYLMRPLVVALRAGSDLVGQGLRTLELCVDNLTADYLDPIMAPLIGSKKEKAFPVEIGIDLAIGKLMEVPKGAAAKKSDPHYKKQALAMVKAQLKLRLGADNLPDDFPRLVRLQAQDLLSKKSDADLSLFETPVRDRSETKKMQQDVMLKKLFKACIFAVSLPDFSAEATALLSNICKHVTIIEVARSLGDMKVRMKPFDVNAGEGPPCIDSKVLGDAIVESLASDLPAVRDAAKFAAQEVYDSTSTIFGSNRFIYRLSFFSHLSNVFCHSCYQEEWFTKTGGSLGINLMLTKFDLGDSWMLEKQVEYTKALMHVVKDMPPDLPAKTRIAAQNTLELLLKRCAGKSSKADLQPSSQPGQPSRPSKLLQLCNFFNAEVYHMNGHVRETARKSLEIIAKEIGVEVYELLAHQQDRILAPIYNKPLRALPFATQIGYIDAVNYYMSLKNDFLAFDDTLNRLLMECLALADAPDESLAPKPTEYRTHEHIVTLRVSCIKTLTTAMGFDDFQKGPASPTRTRILPKDLLQNGLRPVLANLQDPKRLTTHGLDGLARLLQLLTTYFKVEIGARLLEHIRILADPNSFQRISFTLVEQNEQMKIIAASCGDMGAENRETRYAAVINAINVMHSICNFKGTELWMDKKENLMWFRLVGKNLEQHLRTNTLPQNLRLAAEQAGQQLMIIFTKFLEYNPRDLDSFFNLIESVTAEDFKPNQPIFDFIYKSIICSESIEYRKAIVLRSLEIYVGKSATQRNKTFLLHNLVNPIIAMDIMRNFQQPLSAKSPRLIDRTIIESIHTKVWKVGLPDPSDDLTQPGIDHTRMEVLQLTAMLVKYNHSILQEARKDIIKFGWGYIRLEDVINKHAAYVVIGYFIAHYETPAKIVQQVYFSLLKTNQNEGRALVTQALELIAPVLPKRCNAVPGDRNPVWAAAPRRILAEEGNNVQQMTSIFNFLVKHADLFYESRDKFINLIIGSLRKIALPQTNPNPSNESKKLALHLMSLIWQWEERRVQGKSASPERSLSESPNTKKRKLDSLNEAQTSSPSPSRPGAASANDKPEYLIPSVMRAKMIKYLVEFIASLNERYPLPSARSRDTATSHGPAQPTPSVEICKKSLALLWNLLQPQYWGDLDIDLFPNVTKEVLASDKATAALANERPDKDKPDDKFITNIVNTLQVVRIVVNVKPVKWILEKVPEIQHILEKALKSDNPEIQDCLHAGNEKIDDGRKLSPLLKRILEAVPDDTPMEDADAESEPEASTSEIITFLSAIATETLQANNYISGLNILWTLAQRKASEMDQHIQQVMKALQQKLAREHVGHYQALAGQGTIPPPIRSGEVEPVGIMTPYDLEIQTGLTLKAIDIISLRMDTLADNRRPFLSVLATLVEKSLSNTLCLKILDMVEGWVFKSDGSWPTLKEKTAVLHKMLTFEQRTDQTLLMKFLELVIRIYEDPKITRTELTVRMEHAFLIGTRAQDVDMRNRFMAIFDRSQSKTASTRLNYVIIGQNWDTLADSYWLAQASQLLLGAVDSNHSIHLHSDDFKVMPASVLYETYAKDNRTPTLPQDNRFDSLMASHRRFVAELGDVKVRDIVEPLSQLQHLDPNMAHEIWVALFPIYWIATPKDERSELERGMVTLLTRDYHSRQIDRRPNVVQSLLEGAAKAWPECKLPPHVLKFLAKTYDAWYTALVQLEKAAIKPEIESELVRESNLDALVELYSGLQEDDLFYGTWRRRCAYVETNAALSYEQNGMWDKAQTMYEHAQIKARTGALPFSQGEYILWEDHWVLCAQKLQQWEVLQDFAKHENFPDLLLESHWRQFDIWQEAESRESLDNIIKGVMDAPTPRRTFFQGFMSLLKLHKKTETQADFNKVCDEAIQLSIRKWHQLPKRITNAHIPLLQNFQQLVELHDASVICQSLSQTTAANLDVKSGELKLLLGTWRDRLPNVWDDITAWQDLVTWRQHIFALINSTYLNLLPQQAPNANGASFAYRGYHETAWIINRFAHVARKHNLPEVCINQLSRIYTLPNIEIQEAFLKLREQAKCHYQNPNELNNGLDVINNTNLNYFGPTQKAEFYTLKGMFQEKLGLRDEASEAYGMALFFEIKLPKAWAEWGYFNDRLFKANLTDYTFARNALSCYLEAAGLFKNAKSRKLLTRILWLLSLDDAEGTLSKQFDEYKGETPVWYWITFIPQLLTGLGHKEAAKAHLILSKIAKQYPQALFFQLRTNREDMLAIKKTQEMKEAKNKRAQTQAQNQASNGSSNLKTEIANGARSESASASRPGTASAEAAPSIKTEPGETNGNAASTNSAPVNGAPANGAASASQDVTTSQAPQKRPPWEYTEELLGTLKTAFPLLALSMEAMVDSIQKNFKCPPDEDAYRLIVALLNDGLSYVSRTPSSYAKDTRLPPATEANITRFAETILPPHIRTSFEQDFVRHKPTMFEYIHKLRIWRDKFEEKLDRRTLTMPLEGYNSYLIDFRFQKLDEIEVPGQYLLHKDKNQDFVRIERFMPDVDLVRAIGVCHRRIRIRGHDGSLHPFAIQHPAARHCRREERILQLFRHFNGSLSKRKESRRRNLNFHLPLMIPLAPHIRMVQDDPTYISLQGVYDDHCRRNGVTKDAPIVFNMEKQKLLFDQKQKTSIEHSATAKLETFAAIQERYVGPSLVLGYFTKTYPSFSEFWLFRRQFSYQYAALTFMTYILHMHNRYPHKITISRATGNIWGSELMSCMAAGKALFHNPEPVPFRLTPNIQTLMGPLATEGIYSCAIMAIARCLTEPGFELEQQLCLFVRDEMIFWFTSSHRTTTKDTDLRDAVQINSDMIVKRALSIAKSPEGALPANQTVIDLIAKAVNPMNLAQCDALWMPYL
ncbi:uncharacterized protein EAF02_007453 [Botrytis sinoallii]|uniref:uncharacterized protein n=1 Tax=Botrytis sinoallii TaxID=1463999 RepID=UPI0019012836|nr:uncharacterized protein EAF02_007453 [Botrytis sinoallii]KAF7880607.1 hypothetical protein EAF02_007453 [Botrytis sinoallii]